ncbi:hypothetical protein ABK040_012885 [Willaertia magna]
MQKGFIFLFDENTSDKTISTTTLKQFQIFEITSTNDFNQLAYNKNNGKEVYLLINNCFIIEAIISIETFQHLKTFSQQPYIHFGMYSSLLSQLINYQLDNIYLPLEITIELIENINQIPIIEQIVIQPIYNNQINELNNELKEWIEENEMKMLSLIQQQVSSILTNYLSFSLFNFKFQIIDLKPTNQGFLDLKKTKIILLNQFRNELKNRKLFDFRNLENILQKENDNELFILSDSLTFKPKKELKIKNIKQISTNKILNLLQQFGFKSGNENKKGLLNKEIDPNSIILINNIELLSKLNVSNQSWIKINKNHVGYLCAIQNYESNNDIIYLSNVLYFNLKQPTELLLENGTIPTIANKLILTPIQSPNHFGTTLIDGNEEELKIEQQIYDKQLENYFKKHLRVVHEGDILMIENPKILNFKSNDTLEIQVLSQMEISKKLDTIHEGYTCFKVDKVEGSNTVNNNEMDLKGYLISPNETNLITNGQPIRSYIPTSTDEELNSFKTNTFQQLSKLIEPIISIHESKLNNFKKLVQQHFLLIGEEGSGKSYLIKQLCIKYNLHLLELNGYDIISENDTLTSQNLQQCFQLAKQCTPCLLFIKNFEALDNNNSGGQGPNVKQHSKIRIVKVLKQCLKGKSSTFPLIFIASVSSLDLLSPIYKNLFLTKIENKINLNEKEREGYLFNKLLNNWKLSSMDISLNQLVKQTSGCSINDLEKITDITKSEIIYQSLNNYVKNISFKDILDSGMKWHKKYASSVNGSSGMNSTTNISIPTVKWQDIGGLEKAKQEILDIIQSPLQQHSLKARSGILLYGPPGCGKTLLAKAVATECQLNFMSVKGPELINMYIGESERNVRVVFERARQCKPCVIFFDELDALAPNRGVSGDSGGVMDRVVSQLLAELDDIHSGNNDEDDENNTLSNKCVYVIGATNRPDLIDPALLRPGRFERLVYLGVCKSREDQLKVMKAQTRKFNLHNDVDFESLLDKSDFNLTGADFYAICSDAFMNAVVRLTEEDGSAQKSHHEVIVTQHDFEQALAKITPSVSKEDMARYETLQSEFIQK